MTAPPRTTGADRPSRRSRPATVDTCSSMPSTARWMAARCRTPFVQVMLNNRGWPAPRLSALHSAPERLGEPRGPARRRVRPSPDYGGSQQRRGARSRRRSSEPEGLADGSPRRSGWSGRRSGRRCSIRCADGPGRRRGSGTRFPWSCSHALYDGLPRDRSDASRRDRRASSGILSSTASGSAAPSSGQN